MDVAGSYVHVMSDATSASHTSEPGSGLAIASLVCGIAGFFTAGLASIAAIICGILALKQGQSKGLAITGLVTGGISLLILPIAIIAAIAIPNLLESRVTANQAAAAATLKSGIFPAQIQFQAAGYQDADENGIGEYGLISELSGRVRTNRQAAGMISVLAGPLVKNADFTANGYSYAIYLPNGDGRVISDGDDLEARHTTKSIQTKDQERLWVAYAWPTTPEGGRRVFAICQDGQVRSPTNSVPGKRPAWNDLFAGTDDWDKPTWPVYAR
jgi:type II secretory pathway pseudopilin PulG